MSLLVIAYPLIEENDFNAIQRYRMENDGLYFSVVIPHFTFVFPVLDILLDEFSMKVYEKLRDSSQIDFVIRCAILHKDALIDNYHSFLVPDEGFSQMVKLHDRVYSGALKQDHLLDLDYIPHMGIGNSKNPLKCKQMVDDWNQKELVIKGTISELTLVHFENNQITDLQTLQLVQS